MKMAAAPLAVLLWMLAASAALAQEPTARPTLPNRSPVGAFRVVPPSGPPGTVVTVSGEFDENITGVRFRCLYRDLSQEGLVEANHLPQPSPSFSFKFQIPARLPLAQGAGATLTTLIGQCEFLAFAGHIDSFYEVPFIVTENTIGGLPPSGNPSGGGTGDWTTFVTLALTALGATALLVGQLVGPRVRARP